MTDRKRRWVSFEPDESNPVTGTCPNPMCDTECNVCMGSGTISYYLPIGPVPSPTGETASSDTAPPSAARAVGIGPRYMAEHDAPGWCRVRDIKRGELVLRMALPHQAHAYAWILNQLEAGHEIAAVGSRFQVSPAMGRSSEVLFYEGPRP